jgi:bacillithiol biosynthesis cysteine-adding enzyme BshC
MPLDAISRECLSCTALPNATPLFLDYLYDFPKVSRFYPRPPAALDWLGEQAASLRYDDARRHAVASVLERQNRAFGASAAMLENISRLRRGASAIVTGQQTGLFGGPLLALLKALGAASLANAATARGINCVPIFWLATEDHDLAEINHATFPAPAGGLETVLSGSRGIADAPVGEIRLDDTTSALVEQTAALLSSSQPDGAQEIVDLLRQCYRPGETFGSAFGRLYANLLGEFGIILLDSADPELDSIAAPVYQAAIAGSHNLRRALVERGADLRAAGYHEQVKVTEGTTLLFQRQRGARVVIQSSNGDFLAGDQKFSARELQDRALAAPHEFSPNALLRPVLQDYLLPTLAYMGGPAEVAYFAQAAVVYQEILGRVTPVLPRFSATVTDARARRLLEQYGLKLTDAFVSSDQLHQELASRALPSGLQAQFEQSRAEFSRSLESIKTSLARLDPTLVEAAERSASKITHQMESLETRAATILARRNSEVERHASWLSSTLYPNKNLQEREICGIWFLARHGRDLLRSLYDCAQDGCPDHQILHA